MLPNVSSGRRPSARRPTASEELPHVLRVVLGESLGLAGDSTLQAEPAVFGPVASDPTASRLIDHGRSTGAMGDKRPLLGCECGELGCWPLMARVTVTADLVTWGGFEQPYRMERNYTAFGPLQFDRRQYDNALRALSTEIRSDEA
ncbi:hypothetical protein AB0B79_29265 [Streptomyces sp. NPDC039022]|uniref:hypothetical protein n=1 Tax=Streptomyces sp. NPDC039022 TaxID=3157091 RepID=UPI0033DEBDA8